VRVHDPGLAHLRVGGPRRLDPGAEPRGRELNRWMVAARLSVRRGEKAIRYVLIVAVLIMAAKILGVF
ncbi:MAG TPA: hypothetical protein VGA18_10040, partial [Rhodothermales bacterium]